MATESNGVDLSVQSCDMAVEKSIFDLPPLKKGILQLQNRSLRLLQKICSPIGKEGRFVDSGDSPCVDFEARNLLLNAGIDIDKISGCVKRLVIPELADQKCELDEGGLQAYFEKQCQKSLLSAIERSQERTLKAYNACFSDYLLSSWERIKKSLIDDSYTTCFEKEEHIDARRVMACEKPLRDLNSAILEGRNFNIMKFDTGDPKIRACWAIINKVYFSIESRSNFDLKSSTREASKLRLEVASKIRTTLEENYLSGIISSVRSIRPNLGGTASLDKQIQIYLTHIAVRGINENLEFYDNDPIWAHLFLYVRSGLIDHALKYILSKKDFFKKSSSSFFEHFTSQQNSSKAHRELLKDWCLMRKYNDNLKTDPFKYILFKISGKFEPSLISTSAIFAPTIEDYIWILLNFVQEESLDPQGFDLRDVAIRLRSISRDSFDDAIVYFHTLLFCGEIDAAIASLYDSGWHRIEAIHFAIAFAYMGLIKQPQVSKDSNQRLIVGSPIILPSRDTYTPVSLNYMHIVSHAAKTIMEIDAELALQYAYALAILGDKAPMCTEEAHHLIRNIIANSKTPESIVGSIQPDGSVKHGSLRSYLQLVQIRNLDDYYNRILLGAANIAKEERNYALAIDLLSISKKYSEAMDTLSEALTESILLYENAQEDVESIAVSTIKLYQNNLRMAAGVVDESMINCTILTKLYRFARLTKEKQYEQAIATLRETGLLPLSNSIKEITEKAQKLSELSKVRPILPVIVSIAIKAMSALLADAKYYTNDPRLLKMKQTRLSDIKKVNEAIILLAGSPGSTLPQSVVADLNKFSSELE